MLAQFPSQKPIDPREQPVLDPEAYYLTFRRQLAGSEQLRVLAMYLAHVHYLHEGWKDVPASPSQEFLLPYRKAAELAVRYVTQDCRAGAETRAAEYAENRMDSLLGELRSCDTTAEDALRIMRQFAADILSVWTHHLAIGCGRHPVEWTLFYAEEAKDNILYADEEREDQPHLLEQLQRSLGLKP
jgi:hypothetical protein